MEQTQRLVFKSSQNSSEVRSNVSFSDAVSSPKKRVTETPLPLPRVPRATSATAAATSAAAATSHRSNSASHFNGSAVNPFHYPILPPHRPPRSTVSPEISVDDVTEVISPPRSVQPRDPIDTSNRFEVLRRKPAKNSKNKGMETLPDQRALALPSAADQHSLALPLSQEGAQGGCGGAATALHSEVNSTGVGDLGFSDEKAN